MKIYIEHVILQKCVTLRETNQRFAKDIAKSPNK